MKAKPKADPAPQHDVTQHHDVRVRTTDERKRALAINPRVDQLWVDGRLSDNQYQACGRLYHDYAFGVEGASDRDMFNSIRASGAPGGYSELQLDAVGKFKAALKAVASEMGETGAQVLYCAACLDLSYAKISRLTKIEADVVPAAVVMCIVALAAFYDTVDSARKLEN